jgi:hypothetical protein
MSETRCTEQLKLFEVGRQQVTMSFDGGNVVSDTGLLPIRELDRESEFSPKRPVVCPIHARRCL